MSIRRRRGPGRAALSLTAPILAICAIAAPATALATPNPKLTRYPYLTDSIQSSITVNWGTTRGTTTGSVRYGPPGSCTAYSQSASKTGITVGSKPEYQWKATITVTPDTHYCYRVFLSTTDLLGTDPSPAFTSQVAAGSPAPFTFDVFGDWGFDEGGSNPDQANVMAQMARSGARFAVMTGDTAYPQGSQTNYGDLQQTGANISGVFGRSYWAVPGRSLPVFNVPGNHGFVSGNTQVLNWPEGNAAGSSGGSYRMESYPSINGSAPGKYPSFWYAFDAGPARFYVLTAAWADNGAGAGGVYAADAAAHWQTSSAEYQWLAQDLATHPRAVKFAFWHYPLYADTYNSGTDTALHGMLQPLLDHYGVNIAFNGHAHGYERNAPDAWGMVSYVFGNGGADLGVLDAGCSAFDLYAIGGHGTHCGLAPAGLTSDHVFGFARVTVNGKRVTVTPTDERGRAYDVHTYDFPLRPRTPPPPPASPDPPSHHRAHRHHTRTTVHIARIRHHRHLWRVWGRVKGSRGGHVTVRLQRRAHHHWRTRAVRRAKVRRHHRYSTRLRIVHRHHRRVVARYHGTRRAKASEARIRVPRR